MKKYIVCILFFASPAMAITRTAVTMSDGSLQSGTTGFNVSSGTVNTLHTSTFNIRGVMSLGCEDQVKWYGKPDARFSFCHDNDTNFNSRPGFGIDVIANAYTRVPVLVVTNKSTPGISKGSALAFYGQNPDTADVQQAIVAFSQDVTTHTAKYELFLRSSSSTAAGVESNSIPVMATYGILTDTNTPENMLGYGLTMFGPTGDDFNNLTAYGTYTPGSVVHVASDFGDSRDGIRIERRRSPNGTRVGMRIDSDGHFIVDTETGTVIDIYGLSGSAPYDQHQIDINGRISLSGQLIARGTREAEDLGEGYLGETTSSRTIVFSDIALTNTYQNVAQVSISSGDWEVWGVVVGTNGVVNNNFSIAISTYSGSATTDHIEGWNEIPSAFSGTNVPNTLNVPRYRISSAVNTIAYIKSKASFSGGAPQVKGSIRGRRVH